MTIDLARRLQILARWHRRVALLVSVWVLVLAASGLLINHAHDLGLDRSPLPGALQRAVYGLEPPDGRFCGQAAVPQPECSDIFGRLPLSSGELLLGANSLFLLDRNGSLLENIAVAQLGLGRLRAGLREGAHVYLRDDRQTVRTDLELLDWQVAEAGSAAELDGLEWQLRGDDTAAISWERFLLDLHAGRFLGWSAKGFTDLMGGLVLLLALSGLWLWWLKRGRA